MSAATTIRALLVIIIAAMAVLALVYLRQRDLSLRDKIGWGLVAVLFPLLGPFLVILHRPGRFRKQPEGGSVTHPARLRMFALLGPRRRRLIRPLVSPSIEKKDHSV